VSSPHVLLVDDEEAALRGLRRELMQLGWQVQTAGDAESAAVKSRTASRAVATSGAVATRSHRSSRWPGSRGTRRLLTRCHLRSSRRTYQPGSTSPGARPMRADSGNA